MFTGLIESIGKVKSVQRLQGDMRLAIAPRPKLDDCRVGDSISVNGVCLTITAISEDLLSMDVSGETLYRSTLGHISHGDNVNLERALRLSDRLGGHLVSGHVDGVGKILEKRPQQRFFLIKIGLDDRFSRYTIEKGSIAVDGISLTINCRGNDFFEVTIIPQTGAETTLVTKKTGDAVNIETDLIGKYVENFFLKDNLDKEKKSSTGINLETLLKQGFGK